MIKIKKHRRNPYTTSDEVYALGQHICMSAHKARRIIDQIRGRSYEETLMILELMPYRACYWFILQQQILITIGISMKRV